MSNVKPAIDPVSVLLEPGERSPMDKSEESVAAGMVGLVYLAREAVEERRHKQCLEATKAILKIDPDHKEARKIQSSVRTELDQQFVDAQALARDAQLKDDRILYERAAAALRRIIDVDPDNLEARTLLHDTVAASYFRPAAPAVVRSRWRIPGRSIVAGLLAIVVLVAAIAIVRKSGLQFSELVPARIGVFTTTEASASTRVVYPVSQPAAPETAAQVPLPTSSVLIKSGWSETAPLRVVDADPVLRVASPAPPLSKPSAPSVANVAAAGMGALAVSAAVPVEIYRGEENLGSTPATLQLPEGPQTLEYRYQGLRQTLTHVIAPNQTTTATVSFLVKVQVNAQPWAQVFMDGINLTPIGQTPLGDVSVPIGSVLVFQNPAFPAKRYRVTARDTAIQIAFP